MMLFPRYKIQCGWASQDSSLPALKYYRCNRYMLYWLSNENVSFAMSLSLTQNKRLTSTIKINSLHLHEKYVWRKCAGYVLGWKATAGTAVATVVAELQMTAILKIFQSNSWLRCCFMVCFIQWYYCKCFIIVLWCRR